MIYFNPQQIFIFAVTNCLVTNLYLETFFGIIYKEMIFVKVRLHSIVFEPLQQCFRCIPKFN